MLRRHVFLFRREQNRSLEVIGGNYAEGELDLATKGEKEATIVDQWQMAQGNGDTGNKN